MLTAIRGGGVPPPPRARAPLARKPAAGAAGARGRARGTHGAGHGGRGGGPRRKRRRGEMGVDHAVDQTLSLAPRLPIPALCPCLPFPTAPSEDLMAQNLLVTEDNELNRDRKAGEVEVAVGRTLAGTRREKRSPGFDLSMMDMSLPVLAGRRRGRSDPTPRSHGRSSRDGPRHAERPRSPWPPATSASVFASGSTASHPLPLESTPSSTPRPHTPDRPDPSHDG